MRRRRKTFSTATACYRQQSISQLDSGVNYLVTRIHGWGAVMPPFRSIELRLLVLALAASSSAISQSIMDSSQPAPNAWMLTPAVPRTADDPRDRGLEFSHRCECSQTNILFPMLSATANFPQSLHVERTSMLLPCASISRTKLSVQGFSSRFICNPQVEILLLVMMMLLGGTTYNFIRCEHLKSTTIFCYARRVLIHAQWPL